MSFSVAPGFLIAMPSLLDPNFVRSVVLLAAHTDEGAFGIVINRPHPDEITLADVCREAGLMWTGDKATRALAGGPVEPERGWVLHDDTRRFEATQRVADGLAVSTSQDALAAYAAEPRGRFLLALGYAGWGPGQLDREITEGSWLTSPIDVSIIFDTPMSKRWRAALELVGVDPAHLIDAGPQIN